MDFVALAVASALVWKIVSFGKAALNGDKNAVVTQLLVWGAAVGVAFLLAASDFAGGIKVGSAVLGDLNAASVVLFGVSLGSTASVGFDVKKAIDVTDTAKELPLLSNIVD
jgi:predicted membrane protein